MAASRAKTSGKKKAAGKKKTAAKSPARKKTAGKAAARKKTTTRKTAKATTRKKTAGRKKTATRKTSARKKTTAKTIKKMTSKQSAAAKKTAKKSSGRGKSGSEAMILSNVEQIAPYKPKKGEEYMNENQRAHFRELLLAWKRDLMEEADRTVHHMQDEASNFPDPNDRASQESEFSLELRTRDRERKLLRKIDQTLKRVETEDYGWCDSCGAEIGIRRLEARPTATLCFDCKTLDEIRERQKGI